MIIQEERIADTLIVKPEGKMDTLSSPELDQFIRDRCGDARQIIFDLEKVDYISSAGIRVLVQTYIMMKDRDGVVLRHVCPQIMDTLRLTGYIHVLKIEQAQES